MNIAVFASHGGSNLQAIIDACKSGKLDAKVSVVISNNSDAMALKRAESDGIPHFHYSQKVIPEPDLLDKTILATLKEHDVQLVFLAGYLKKLGTSILKEYENRVINVHPSLLPKYGGKGMHGINVHKAVIEAKEKETGVTIHYVNEVYDTGEIIAQKKVPVISDDTAESLAARVLKQEHILVVEVLSHMING